MIALLFAALVAQDWEYRQGIGFVDTSSMDRKSPEEFFKHAIALREKGDPEAAIHLLGLILDHVTDAALRERALYERAETHLKAGFYYEAYRDAEAFALRYPQSDRAAGAKRLEMSAALELARHGYKEKVLGIPLISSSKRGIELLKDALRRYPREDFSAEYGQKLGMFYYEREEYDEAEAEFQNVLDQYSDSPLFILALYMLGRTAEKRFDSITYDMKPLKEARRHYERFIEEADRMRKLPPPAGEWLDRWLPDVKERLARTLEQMARKELQTAEYYDWKGLPKSAEVSYRAIVRYYPRTDAARKARERLGEAPDPQAPKRGDGPK